MTVPEDTKLKSQRTRPSRKTATEKASALANVTSALGRPAKSLGTLGLGAAATAFIGPGNASATLVTPTSLTFTGNIANWNIDGDATVDFQFGASATGGAFSVLSIVGQTAGADVAATMLNPNGFFTNFAINYGIGAIVGPATVTANDGKFASSTAVPLFGTFTGNFVFTFTPTVGGPSIGWANITFTHPLTGSPFPPIVVNSGAYFPFSGGGLLQVGNTTGLVPEPSSFALVLLGMGALGLREWRRRKGDAGPKPDSE